MTLTYDHAGRAIQTHRCPLCAVDDPSVGYMGPARCREHDIEALPIVGCELPPDRIWLITLAYCSVVAPTKEKAQELVDHTLAERWPQKRIPREQVVRSFIPHDSGVLDEPPPWRRAMLESAGVEL